MRRAPWWLFVAAGTFLAYFGLLVYCDAIRPEHRGLRADFAEGRMRVEAVVPGSPAAEAGLRPGDVIRAWDGQPIAGRRDWVAVEANAAIGRVVRLGIERDGTELDAWLSTPQVAWDRWTWAGVTLAAVRLVQAITLGLGVFLVFRRPGNLVATLGGWLLASAGVFSVVLPYRIAAVWRALPAPVGALLWFPHASSLLVMAELLAFFLVFPIRRVRSRRTWFLLWAPLGLVALGPLGHTWRAVYRPNRATGYGDWAGPLLVLSVACALAAVAVAWRSYRDLQDTNGRRRMRVLFVGAAFGGLAGGPLMTGYWYLSPYLELFGSPLYVLLTLGLLAVPLSFTYAILRHRLFDVRVIIRQGLQYAAARNLLLSLVPMIAAFAAVDLLIHWSQSVGTVLQARASIYLALGIVALVAHRERQRWLDALDRRFFRERYDATRLLRQVADDVRDAGDLAAVAARVAAQVERALHPEYVALLLRSEGEPAFHPIATAGTVGALHVPPDGAMLALLRVLRKPVEVTLADGDWLAGQLPPDEIDDLRRSHLGMLVPVALERQESQLILALGAKRSEEPYSLEDRELLAAIAANLGLLLDRSAAQFGISSLQTAATAESEPACTECGTCGSCWPAGRTHCPGDGALLAPTPLPLVFAGRYRLVRRLGRGGMGTVYEAKDEALDRPVAIKVLRDDRLGGAAAAVRFRQEAQLAASFSHPNVVTVHDFGTIGTDRGYLVMELLDGVSLREELGRRKRFELPLALEILRGVVAAVEAAHARRIVHRDLKPENIVLVPAGPSWQPKVLDFGIAKILASSGGSEPRAETTGVLLGTPLYMAPEHLRGEDVSPAWDLWAVAVIACEMLAGRHPFSGGPLPGGSHAGAFVNEAEMFPDLPALAPALARALALDPAARPGSASALLSDLEAALKTR